MLDSTFIILLALATFLAVLVIAIYQWISVRRAQNIGEPTVTERSAGIGNAAHKVGGRY